MSVLCGDDCILHLGLPTPVHKQTTDYSCAQRMYKGTGRDDAAANR